MSVTPVEPEARLRIRLSISFAQTTTWTARFKYGFSATRVRHRAASVWYRLSARSTTSAIPVCRPQASLSVLFPVYALADRILAVPGDRRRRRHREPRVPPLNYIRIPALGSALMLLLFLPGIIKQGASTYWAATGQTQDLFLGRWLLLTAVMFAVSAAAYGIRLAAARRRGHPCRISQPTRSYLPHRRNPAPDTPPRGAA
jgi:hypothetical protein